MRQLDEMKYLVFGEDLKINDKLIVRNPLISEIKEIGELNYFTLINLVIMKPYDDMVNLWENGIDYETLTDFDMFLRNVRTLALNKDMSKILFGDIDLSEFEISVSPDNDEFILTNGDIVIDKMIHRQIAEYIRFIHFIEYENDNEIKPANQSVKEYLIKRMKRKAEFNAKKPIKQNMSNLISSIVNIPNCSYNYENIQDLHISQLYDSFYRILKRDNADNLRRAIYSGSISCKDVDNSSLEWFGTTSKQNNQKEKGEMNK